MIVLPDRDWMKMPEEGGVVPVPPTLPPSSVFPLITTGPLPRSWMPCAAVADAERAGEGDVVVEDVDGAFGDAGGSRTKMAGAEVAMPTSFMIVLASIVIGDPEAEREDLEVERVALEAAELVALDA